MKARIRQIAIIAMVALASSNIYSQNKTSAFYVGATVGGGFSHMLLGNPFDANNAIATPQLGGGGIAGLFFEFEYNKFLLHTGVNVHYSINSNQIFVDGLKAGVVEYPNMQYHYSFDKYFEQTTYGAVSIPIMLGASFKQWYFLGGAKIGVASFANMSQGKADIKVYATDQEVIGPLENMPTHGLDEYRVKGDKHMMDFNPFNVMASAEVGIKLNKSAWVVEKKKRMDRAERYREAKRKKTLKELTNYRLALFADYGLINLRTAYLNPIPHGGEPSGGLIVMQGSASLTPYPIIGYRPYQHAALKNLMVGMKFNIQFEIPQKRKVGLPYVYVYVQDKNTDKKVTNARVQIQRDGVKSKSKYNKYTDNKYGRVGKGFAPGNYWTQVSHKNYCTTDTIRFVHRDDFDTLHVALTPLQDVCWKIEDALTSKPMAARVKVTSMDGKLVVITDDPVKEICTKLDHRYSYQVEATAEGYEPYSQVFANIDSAAHIQLMPLPKKTFILQNMHFATAKTTILPSSQQALDLLYELLKENPQLYIRIVGHTDDVGSDKDNQILSEGRANSIHQAMVERGIDAKRIQILGKGESAPLVPNTSDTNRQKNRRVEIEIVSGGDDINIERIVQQ